MSPTSSLFDGFYVPKRTGFRFFFSTALSLQLTYLTGIRRITEIRRTSGMHVFNC